MANDFESTLAELSRETAQSLHDAAEKLRRSRYKTYRATKTFSLPGIGVELKAGMWSCSIPVPARLRSMVSDFP